MIRKLTIGGLLCIVVGVLLYPITYLAYGKFMENPSEQLQMMMRVDLLSAGLRIAACLLVGCFIRARKRNAAQVSQTTSNKRNCVAALLLLLGCVYVVFGGIQNTLTIWLVSVTTRGQSVSYRDASELVRFLCTVFLSKGGVLSFTVCWSAILLSVRVKREAQVPTESGFA